MFVRSANRNLLSDHYPKHLDFKKVVTIMAAFYSARLSMTHAHFRRFVRHFFILRTTNSTGAKSTPNTPIIFQEIT